MNHKVPNVLCDPGNWKSHVSSVPDHPEKENANHISICSAILEMLISEVSNILCEPANKGGLEKHNSKSPRVP